MSLHQTRAVIAGLTRLKVDLPSEVADQICTFDALLTLRRRLVVLVKPMGPGSPFSPPEQTARMSVFNDLTAAALAGTADVDAALQAADKVTEAEITVGRAKRALALIDELTGNAADNPVTRHTMPELALVAHADQIFGQLHVLACALVAATEKRLALLGGGLPSDPTFAITSTKPARDAFKAVMDDGERYRELRAVQRGLLVLDCGDEAEAAALWRHAELRQGQANQRGTSARTPVLDGWSEVDPEPTLGRQGLLPAQPGRPAAERLVFHTHNGSVWVPSLAELRKAAASAAAAFSI